MNIGVFVIKYFALTLLYGIFYFLTLFTKGKKCDKMLSGK